MLVKRPNYKKQHSNSLRAAGQVLHRNWWHLVCLFGFEVTQFVRLAEGWKKNTDLTPVMHQMCPERGKHTIRRDSTESSVLCNAGLRMGRVSDTERESNWAQKANLVQQMVETNTWGEGRVQQIVFGGDIHRTRNVQRKIEKQEDWDWTLVLKIKLWWLAYSCFILR